MLNMFPKFELNFDPGRGAGLVGAQHVHGAQIVDRGKTLHDDLASRQSDRRMGKGDRYHWQAQPSRRTRPPPESARATLSGCRAYGPSQAATRSVASMRSASRGDWSTNRPSARSPTETIAQMLVVSLGDRLGEFVCCLARAERRTRAIATPYTKSILW